MTTLLSDTFGIFNHYLYGDENWVRTTERFDVERLARNLAKIGASHYCITLMQRKKYMLAPNSTYDRIAGTQPGEACARRDLPMEIGRALAKYGIDLYLYFTGDGPLDDPDIGRRFGYTTQQQPVTMDFVRRWASVLEEYSIRYGSLVKGWWIDGCYDGIGYTDDLLEPYYRACKAGNPDSLVALNNGVSPNGLRKRCPWEDFTCGEYNDFTFVPSGRFLGGAQAHILAPLGIAPDGNEWGSWGKTGLKRSAPYLTDYIRRLHKAGCALTIDIIVYPDGTFDAAQFNELCKVSEQLRSGEPPAAGTMEEKGNPDKN